MSAAGPISPSEVDRERDAWVRTVDALLADVERWSRQRNWLVARQPKTIDDDNGFGPYQTEVLFVQCGQGRVYLDPIGRFVARADGRVDLCAFPSLNRVMLLRRGDTWRVMTDSGVAWPKPWGDETFAELALELADSV